MQAPARTLWTIGHSTRPWDEFVALLRGESIACLADGTAAAPAIDQAVMETIGMPRGPLAYVAQLGAATYRARVDKLVAEFGSRFALPPALTTHLPAEAVAAAAS